MGLELKYEPPPYPVFKSYFVPFYDPATGEIRSIRELRPTDVEEWRRIIEKMREFLELAARVSGVDGEAKVERVGDLIVLFLRTPLLREPLEGILPSPLKLLLSVEILPAEELKRLGVEELRNHISFAKFAYEVRKSISKHQEWSRIWDILEESREMVERCWFTIPADTRPCFNTSGLIPHSLTTSALAWTRAVNEEKGRRETALVRLAALLHDFGKPFSYENHVPRSMEVAKYLLSGILDNQTLSEVLEGIKYHHSEAHPYGKLIRWADRLASATDRVKVFLKAIVEERIGREVTEDELDSWEFWQECAQEVASLSEKFVREIRESSADFTTFRLPPELERELKKQEIDKIEEVRFVGIDTGGLQAFIGQQDELRSVGAASFTIDCLVMSQIPWFVQQGLGWLPLESFLYTAGGNVTLLLPSKLLDDFRKLLRSFQVDPIELRDADVPFKVLYFELSKDLGQRLSLKKLTAEGGGVAIPYEKFRESQKGLKEQIEKLGTEFHFGKRWEEGLWIEGIRILPSEAFGKTWEDACKNVMEIISGHDFEELERGERKRNYAVLSADGNLMGAFMGTCISLTDMYERSARLDIALKRAFEETVRELYFGLEGVDSAEARRTLVRLKLGLLYMGGDDMLALMPSWLAPLVANSLAEKFRKHMGCARGISIGVAAGPSKAPVWSLIEAARELQQKAKDRARENPTNSFVCLDVSEVTLSRTSVEYRRSLLEKEKISRQPFLVGESNELLSALRSLFGPKSLYTCAYKVSRADETEEKKELKKIRALLREALTQARKLFSDPSSSSDLVIEVSRVYLIREMNRSKEEEKPIYERVLGFSELKNGHASYADAELLAKMLGGGII